MTLRPFQTEVLDPAAVSATDWVVLDRGIENLFRDGKRHTTLVVGFAYGTDLGRAREVIRAATKQSEGVLTHPAPRIMASELSDSSMNFDVDFWHRPEEAERRSTRDRVIESVHQALSDAGITIPFPQRTVWFGETHAD